MKAELTILIVWFEETNPDKIACFEENRKSLIEYNPGVNVITIMNPFDNLREAWLSTDLAIYLWYKENCDNLQSERYLLLEWDCWCNMNLKEYYKHVWDCDVVASSVVYPERDDWPWFNSIINLPVKARMFATGVVPFCGILVSEKAMKAICEEIIKPIYRGMIGELRFGTIAAMLGFDPVPNPVCSRTITWKLPVPFSNIHKGLHHPRKTLSSPYIIDTIEGLLNLDKHKIPKIIHQTWKDNSPPEYLRSLSETWKVFHQDWTYILWTDAMNHEFIKRYFPAFLLQFESYPYDIQRVDAVRYFILYKIGGLFIDIDFECFESIDPLINDAECVFSLEPIEHCEQYNKEKIIGTAFMACAPGNNFFKVVCNSLLANYAWGHKTFNYILSTTGAFALTDMYDKYERKEEVKLLPSDIVYPFTADEAQLVAAGTLTDELQEKIQDAYAVHHFLRQWN